MIDRWMSEGDRAYVDDQLEDFLNSKRQGAAKRSTLLEKIDSTLDEAEGPWMGTRIAGVPAWSLAFLVWKPSTPFDPANLKAWCRVRKLIKGQGSGTIVILNRPLLFSLSYTRSHNRSDPAAKQAFQT